MRQEVSELVALGSLPDEDADEEVIARYEKLVLTISQPVTDEEARVLVGLFGPDDCYGLAWTLLYLIETAPGWPLEECLENTSNEWIRRLRTAAETAKKHHMHKDPA
jgi:hypothetical protein